MQMRIVKIVGLSFALLVAGFWVWAFVIDPAIWYPQTRAESVRVLRAARSTNELASAVGGLGLIISMTNNSWIAIRYCDTHGGHVQSCAVACDSGGGWFESDRHFCGSLSGWPRLKASVLAEEEQRKMDPDLYTNLVSRADLKSGSLASYRELSAIESAPDLESARGALRRMGFRDLRE